MRMYLVKAEFPDDQEEVWYLLPAQSMDLARKELDRRAIKFHAIQNAKYSVPKGIVVVINPD